MNAKQNDPIKLADDLLADVDASQHAFQTVANNGFGSLAGDLTKAQTNLKTLTGDLLPIEEDTADKMDEALFSYFEKLDDDGEDFSLLAGK